ncbi:MAG: PQQ-binding-like beta-propeller repeat protein [Chitinophagales bacterium]|nr:PQQ-binding-like beta-propeller repeat protein [Chitinophagales bacterium]
MSAILLFANIILSLLFVGCKPEPLNPEPPSPPPPTDVSPLKILWQKPLTQDTMNGIYGSARFVTPGGDILYTTDFTLPSAKVVLLNGIDGSKKWEYQAFAEALLEQHVFQISDHILIHNWRYDDILTPNGQLLWKNKVEEPGGGMPRANVIGDNFYTVHFSGPLPYCTSMSIVRSHYAQLSWDTLVTIQTENDGFYVNLEPPTLWMNPQGDSVLIIRDGGVRASGGANNGKNRASLYAFNLRTRQFDWVQKNIDAGGAVSIAQPLIEGDKMYINGVRTLHCFDLNTGNTIWQKEFPEAIMDGNITVYKNTLMVPSTQIGMWGVDKQTGSILWYNKDVDGNVLLVVQFDGIVYCTSTGYARLYAVNAETGATIWKENSPNRNSRHPNASFAFAGIAIDTVNRKLYTADKYYLMFIALPEK